MIAKLPHCDVQGIQSPTFLTAVSKYTAAGVAILVRNLPPIVDKVTETSPYC